MTSSTAAVIQESERLDYLDSSRGLAAMIVLVYHTNDFIFYHILDQKTNDWFVSSHLQYFISFILNGTTAVSYFFVLSGFVLSYSFLKHNRNVGLREFIIKRTFRIFPLYIFVVALAAILKYNSLPDAPTLFKEFALVSGIHTLVPPGWSLTIEYTWSLMVPFLILIIQKKFNWFVVLVFLMTIFATFIEANLLAFMLGILLASLFCNKRIVKDSGVPVVAMGPLKTIFVIVLGFMLYSFQPAFKIFLSFISKFDNFLSFFRMNIWMIYSWTAAIGSAIFLYLILRSDRAKRFLRIPFLVFIGKISFGLYLVHWLFIYYLSPYYVHLFLGMNVALVYLLLNIFIFLASGVLATILHYLIELPFIRYGKIVANKTQPFARRAAAFIGG